MKSERGIKYFDMPSKKIPKIFSVWGAYPFFDPLNRLAWYYGG
jgi:hypothetical protein